MFPHCPYWSPLSIKKPITRFTITIPHLQTELETLSTLSNLRTQNQHLSGQRNARASGIGGTTISAGALATNGTGNITFAIGFAGAHIGEVAPIDNWRGMNGGRVISTSSSRNEIGRHHKKHHHTTRLQSALHSWTPKQRAHTSQVNSTTCTTQQQTTLQLTKPWRCSYFMGVCRRRNIGVLSPVRSRRGSRGYWLVTLSPSPEGRASQLHRNSILNSAIFILQGRDCLDASKTRCAPRKCFNPGEPMWH